MLGEMIQRPAASVRAGIRPAQAGLTLVELLVSVAIVGVLVALAVPSMYEFVMRKRVEGTADELIVDLRYLRSMVAKNNRPGRIHFGKTDTYTCYTIYHHNALMDCDCTATPVCSALGGTSIIELKTVRLPTSARVSIAPTEGSASRLEFSVPVGLPKSGVTVDISIKADSGGEVRMFTTATGRPQLCSVTGHTSAYPACPTAAAPS